MRKPVVLPGWVGKQFRPLKLLHGEFARELGGEKKQKALEALLLAPTAKKLCTDFGRRHGTDGLRKFLSAACSIFADDVDLRTLKERREDLSEIVKLAEKLTKKLARQAQETPDIPDTLDVILSWTRRGTFEPLSPRADKVLSRYTVADVLAGLVSEMTFRSPGRGMSLAARPKGDTARRTVFIRRLFIRCGLLFHAPLGGATRGEVAWVATQLFPENDITDPNLVRKLTRRS